MKTLRAYTICCLLVFAFGLSGCATVRRGEAATHEADTYAWGDLTTTEKIESYLWLWVQLSLVGAGQSLAGHGF